MYTKYPLEFLLTLAFSLVSFRLVTFFNFLLIFLQKICQAHMMRRLKMLAKATQPVQNQLPGTI